MTTRKTTLPPIHPSEQKTIKISKPPIRLGQFLKHAGIVQNGLEAKVIIQNGEVTVNGQLELRRGRQLIHGDLVSTGDTLYLVECI